MRRTRLSMQICFRSVPSAPFLRLSKAETCPSTLADGFGATAARSAGIFRDCRRYLSPFELKTSSLPGAISCRFMFLDNVLFALLPGWYGSPRKAKSLKAIIFIIATKITKTTDRLISIAFLGLIIFRCTAPGGRLQTREQNTVKQPHSKRL